MKKDKINLAKAKIESEQKKLNSLPKSNKKKIVEVQKLRDDVRQVVDKNGIVKYLDKDGNEISKELAFTTSKVEVADDGEVCEYEEVIDPVTGKRVVQKKQPTYKESIDPKTGKKVRKATKIMKETDANGNEIEVE